MRKDKRALDRMFLLCSITSSNRLSCQLRSCWAKRMFYQTIAGRDETARVTADLVRSAAKAAFLTLALTMRMSATRAEDVDFSPYRAAAEYCAGEVARPLALSPDRRTLCFDGVLYSNQGLSLVDDLQVGGLFVVRSFGGDDVAMMELAERLRRRNATVVVRSYCLLGCASYFVVASGMTIILKDALVAWAPLVVDGFCLGLRNALDEGLPRLDIGPCGKPLLRTPGPIYALRLGFMSLRRANDNFEEPPESTFIRRALRNIDWRRATEAAGLMWTWHPRYQQSSVRTKIVYERYPESQEEVAALAERLRLRARVIYDP
ncbi:hypothetical protein [Bradyrhizobium aeschynomenes]|uniref:hypothetical protein n=1 Tax=Bradyrhizobium aeschynomenes TaxID=2734909 RepID=UPI001FED902C|nr:hypothetical protein [Bradyrhizobium aeschynomenes]